MSTTNQHARPILESGFTPTKHPLFDGMEPEMIESLFDQARRRRVKAGEILMHEQQKPHAVFALEHGSVRLFCLSPDGMEVTLEVLRAPALFGGIECLLGLGYMNSAQALEPVRITEIDPDAFEQAVNNSHALCHNVLRDVAALLCVSAHRQRALAFDPVPTRLAHVLLSYADAYGLPVQDGIKIRLPINQNHMASLLGVSRRSVTRALKTWSTEGVVKKKGGHYVILDVEHLAALAGEDLLPMVYSSDLPLRAWVPRLIATSRPALPTASICRA